MSGARTGRSHSFKGFPKPNFSSQFLCILHLLTPLIKPLPQLHQKVKTLLSAITDELQRETILKDSEWASAGSHRERQQRVKSGVGQGVLGQAAGTQKSLSLQLMKKKEASVVARRVTGLITRYLMWQDFYHSETGSGKKLNCLEFPRIEIFIGS